MPSTYTTRARLEKQAPGENNNSWGALLNGNMIDMADQAIAGMASYALSGSKTLTANNGASDEARCMYQNITSGSGGTVTIPNVEKSYIVRNNTSGTVTFTTGSGTTALVPAGTIGLVLCEGSNVCRNLLATLGSKITQVDDVGAPAINIGRVSAGFNGSSLTWSAAGLGLYISKFGGSIVAGFDDAGLEMGLDGTVGAPSISWSTDPNTGFYRIGSDNLGVACGGTKILDIASTGLTVSGDGTFNTYAVIGKNASQASGEIRLTGTTPRFNATPDGWSVANLFFGLDATLSSAGNYAGVYVPSGKTFGVFVGTAADGMLVNGTGVGIKSGTTASAANVHQAGGAITDLLVRSTSSLRYKREVQDIPPADADAILACRAIRFKSTSEIDDPDAEFYGLIAEEVAEIDPRLVHYAYQEDQFETVVPLGEDDERCELVPKAGEQPRPDGVQYERLTVLLLDIVKRQNARIEALEARV